MRAWLRDTLLRVGIAFCLTVSLSMSAYGFMPFVMRNDPRPGGAAVPSFDAGARTTSGTSSIPSSINRLCTNAGCTTTSASGITTTHTPYEVIVFVATNGCQAGTDTITVTSSHLTFTNRASTSGTLGTNNCRAAVSLVEFTAQSSGTLSNEVITAACSPCASVSYQEAWAGGFYNMNTGTPFDTNGAIPNVINSGSLSITTTHAADMIFAGFRQGGPVTPDTSFSICAQVDFGGAEYWQVSATQSALSLTGGGGNNGAIGDALQGP
jgi:hypothetical protein